MKTTITTALLTAAVSLLGTPAHADDHATQQSLSSSTDELPDSGAITVRAPVLVSLSDDAVAEPVSVGVDAWYGVNEDLSIGVVHSPYGITGFYGSARGGFCITGEDNGCPDIYDNVGLDTRYRLLERDNIGLAASYAILARSLDPFALSVRGGLAARYAANDRIAVDFHPNLFVGITERDAGNEEIVNLPVTAHVAATSNVGLLLQTGLTMPTEDAGDNYAMPVSVGASYQLTDQLSAAAVFSLPQVLAGDVITNDGAIDATDVRTATISLEFAN